MAQHGEEKLLRKSHVVDATEKIAAKETAYGDDAETTAASSNNEHLDDSERIDTEHKLPLRDVIKQIFIACTIHTIVIQCGISLSFSAVLLPQLSEEYNASLSESLTNRTHQNTTNEAIYIDTAAASWIASLIALSMPTGSLIVGSLMDKFGRKRIAMLSTMPFTISWLMHYWATNVSYIYAARVIAGFGSGLSTVGLIYVAEVSHPKVRGTLLNLNSLFVCLGILITCALGGVLHWRTMSLCNAILSLSTCLAIILLPESPHWLHSFRNNTTRATQILSWLYSTDAVYQLEERRLWDNQIHRQRESLRESLLTFTQPTVYKPVRLLLILFFLQQLTGSYVIIFYAVDIFKRIGNGMEEYRALLLLGAIRFGSAAISSLTSIHFGRKTLLVTSGAGMLIFTLLAASSVGKTTTWCLLTYVAFASVGVMVVPWTLIGELLPLKVRGKLGGFLFALTYLMMFGMVKGFPYFVAAVEMRTIFYSLIGVNAVLIYFVAAHLPETFGKSFREIEEYFLSDDIRIY